MRKPLKREILIIPYIEKTRVLRYVIRNIMKQTVGIAIYTRTWCEDFRPQDVYVLQTLSRIRTACLADDLGTSWDGPMGF